MTAAEIARLIGQEALPAGYATTVERVWRPLAARIADAQRASRRGILVAINGAQGTGKSTLCRFLEALLRDEHGLVAATLSLDDVYLTRAERQALGREVHPLLVTRGVPGTHDVPLAERTIAVLLAGSGPVAVPRFDKAVDDRLPPGQWPRVEAPVEVLLFEGWCVGSTPEPKAALAAPVNALEASEDPDGGWRTAVNEALAGPYARLFERRDLLVMLQAPGFEAVSGWRRLQEAKLRRRTGHGMTDGEIARFVMHYERLTRHMLRTLPSIADAVVPIDASHRAGPVRWLGKWAAPRGAAR